jgi:hypothetical protein
MTDLPVHTPSFRVVLSVRLAGISRFLFAGESSSVGGRELASVASKALLGSGGEDNALVGGERIVSVVFLEMPPPCRPSSPTCLPTSAPSCLVGSE